MNLFENTQPNVQEYFERMSEANRKAWEVSSEFMKKDFERQSSYFQEIANSGRSYFENMAAAANPSDTSHADTTKYFETMQKRYSEIMKEQAEAFQELQSHLKEIYAPVMAVQETPEAPKAKAKAAAK